MTFSRVLIANRGEIARRIIRACRDVGLVSIAVYADADADAAFTREADESVRIGPTPASESYLSIEAILDAARRTGAEAVHPGYGFLSERAEFARAVTEAGLVFIGPSAEVMEAMGRKDRARDIAERAGVPITPRFEPDDIPADAFPVLVKAAAGGGGKGMHVARRPDDLADALAVASREARSAFGDDTLLIEKYVERGRHVEVQVFGDTRGEIVHLYERDCSAQRRHQKVIEEAPAPFLDPAVRQLLLDSAVALCREVGYVGAGTVEFLVAGTDAYFLEMNTRLQVEHPVTEEVTGVDLVQWQFQIAQGEPLPLRQDEIGCEGHAIEARIYAEDPYAGFLPQAGRVVDVQWPWHERVEAALDGPGEVGTAYDPMLAKIITRGATRDEAIDALVAALSETAVLGVTTNTGFVRRLADSTAFREGDVHTGWLDDPELSSALLDRPELSDRALAEAAQCMTEPAEDDPFGCRDGWRSAGHAGPDRVVLVEQFGQRHEIDLDASAQCRREAIPEPWIGAPWLRRIGGRVWVAQHGESWVLEVPDPMSRARSAAQGDETVTAPMPGTVLTVQVAEGDRVVADQRIATMEAMKMELTLVAPHDGVVGELGARPGQQVPIGQVIARVTAADGDA
ncbi:acetyl/propionyl/methylcrotonyl-CoA carboxylase subunit alpha [Aeromicrobium piscarium]|uniref:biotin carboxylase n=1 Tax=Aeromicrobium piscarium TaxID=2590901 RepID=A0A554RMS7_9ACTN|nr:biotin carboxylase N-terminal domain-containing protein [Aeromicrobium piscarium]TSD55423.1 ATP-grasp domain-containing protein [Aeromicrobium piscarium]